MFRIQTRYLNKRIHAFYSILFLCIGCVSIEALAEEDFPIIGDPSWMNNTFLANQRALIDELTRRHFGAQVRGDKSDLFNLQRLIDKGAIERDDKNTLQAMGVVLGDVYVHENSDLHWQVYEDEIAKSHAVCIKNTQTCLFPITMLSRRIEAGLNPDVESVYQKGLNDIAKDLPKRPFAD